MELKAMTRTAILPPIDQSFVREVAALTKEGKKLSDAFADLTEHILLFAREFKRLWDKARKLDRADRGEHHNLLRDELAKIIGTSNKSIRSRWILIGAHATKLINYKDDLPPNRDGLYEIALALENEQPVNQWVRQKHITADSSVREVRWLRRSKKRKKGRHTNPSEPPRSVMRSLPAAITLSFETYGAAAQALQPLLLSDDVEFKVSGDKAFEHAIRERLQDDQDYEKATSHLS
jgi:hypothetical protein